jgi:2-keto-4-pentenoate hydratase/2-oxohepta-3-ene-1,7-dioic acid hydratase in catechol pathway
MQSSSTAQMVFGVAKIVSHLSQFMSLHPGDIVATGTPSGVGLGRKPQVFLKPGDRMTVTVEGLGEQNQLVVAYDK